MSQKGIRIQQNWKFELLENKKCVSVYSKSFDSNLIPGVEFKIFCGMSNSSKCVVILSKTPCTPVNVTIEIYVKNILIHKKYVNGWIDNYSAEYDFSKNQYFDYRLSDSISYQHQCDITWHGYDQSKLQVNDELYGFLKNFLTVPDLNDMLIVIGEIEIPVHKIILGSYSPVFLAMFKTNMTESVNNQIVITDIEVDVMKKVIDFMYTGVIYPVPKIHELLSILEVADKYQIMTLKKWCEQKLSEEMNIENVLEILEGISLYETPQLMQFIISFMVKNKSSIIGLKEFADLHNRRPELLFEFVIHSIAPR